MRGVRGQLHFLDASTRRPGCDGQFSWTEAVQQAQETRRGRLSETVQVGEGKPSQVEPTAACSDNPSARKSPPHHCGGLIRSAIRQANLPARSGTAAKASAKQAIASTSHAIRSDPPPWRAPRAPRWHPRHRPVGREQRAFPERTARGGVRPASREQHCERGCPRRRKRRWTQRTVEVVMVLSTSG